jgi:hypothetical protein
MAAIDSVRQVVEDLAAAGAQRFHASYVADSAGLDIEATRTALAALVQGGDLELFFELRCPECSRVVATFPAKASIPIGKTFESPSCGDADFLVTENDVMVAFSPSQTLLLRVNKRRSTAPRKKKSPLRRIKARIRSRRRLRPSRSTRAPAPS